jgi:hypothetical protein
MSYRASSRPVLQQKKMCSDEMLDATIAACDGSG